MNILVIGESCTDEFVYGNADRLSPEAPVPVFTPKKITQNAGMAGNVSTNLISMCDRNNDTVAVLHQREIITKTRYVDNKSNHMFLRVDRNEENITPFDFTRSAIEQIHNADLIIVSDYNKGFLCDDDLVEIGRMNEKAITVLDTKRRLNYAIIESFDFIKLNYNEYLNNEWIVSSNEEKFIVTLGAKGAEYKGETFPSPSPKETIDVSGAGDTFTSAFALKYKNTSNVKEAIIYANEMAALVVSKRGVATP
jgi:bifunctional ADP-heptose synthase (sugar kinase/adenylyltransferase)